MEHEWRNTMSDRGPTRWQHNRIYPHPINPCVYTYDSICQLTNFHIDNDLEIVLTVVNLIALNLCD